MIEAWDGNRWVIAPPTDSRTYEQYRKVSTVYVADDAHFWAEMLAMDGYAIVRIAPPEGPVESFHLFPELRTNHLPLVVETTQALP